MFLSCSFESIFDSFDSSDSKDIPARSGFAIYIAKNYTPDNSSIDYGSIRLDTIELIETPFLTGSQIESYDSTNHVINLKQSKFNLAFPRTGVIGQLFVVFANNEPVYCGFFWSAISSIPCNWIFIEDPIENNGLTEKQIRISAGYPDPSHFKGLDPRNDSRIIDYFKNQGKLTGNSLTQGNGLNFFLTQKSEHDTTGLRFDIPLNEYILDSEPFVAYNEIICYDTLTHTMDLSINHDKIESRIGRYFGAFVTTLDDKRQYSGMIVPVTTSRTIPTITIIQPYFMLDSLKANQLRITLGYPSNQFFRGEDLRLNKDIVARLKKDNKIK